MTPPILVTASLLVAHTALAQINFVERSDLLASSPPASSGVAMGIADMDGDGRDDIVHLDDARYLQIEYQRASGTAFEHVSIQNSSISDVWSLAIADVDADGFNDIFLGDSDTGMRLLHSNGTGGFNNTCLQDKDIFPQGAIIADINNDGLLDIFACDDNDDPHKYLGLGTGKFSLSPDLIPTFISGTVMGDTNNSGNYAVIWTDYDGDGDGDLYLSKCRQGVSNTSDLRRINRLFTNENGVFTDTAIATGLRDGEQSWSTDFADIDNDGDLDCFILNHGNNTSKLMRNEGDGTFTNITAAAGLGTSLNIYGIQAIFRDLDNDSFVDLIVTATNIGTDTAHRIFKNNGDATFTNLGSLLGTPYIQSLATGDLNHDGFIDIYAGRANSFNSPTAAPDSLYLNNGNANHFLTITLKGRNSNTSSIGARVELIGPWGTQVREVRGGEGYGICSSHSQHFGFGTSTQAATLRVKWPSGLVDEFQNIAADQFITVTEAETLNAADFTAPTLPPALTTSGRLFTPIAFRISADNHPLDYALSGVFPPGMHINPQTGILTWTPDTEGATTVSILATNPAGSTSTELTIQVDSNPLANALDIENIPLVSSPPEWTRDTTTSHDGTDAGRSAAISANSSTALETIVSGPDIARFWWKVSSEADDKLSTMIDGSLVQSISGEVNWEMRFINIPAGRHVIRIEYKKDATQTAGSDAAWVDEFTLLSTIPEPVIYAVAALTISQGKYSEIQIPATQSPHAYTATALPPGMEFDPFTGVISGVPTQPGNFQSNVSATNSSGTGNAILTIFVAADLGLALNAPTLPWSSGGNAVWKSQTTTFHSDGIAAASGDVNDFQESWIETLVQGPGTFSFWWKVSSETIFDGLTFSVNGDDRSPVLSGNINWQSRIFTLTNGPQILRWTYAKDSSASEGSDTAWLDEIAWTPADADNDMLPDGWELLHFKNLSQSGTDDTDGDGQNNIEEELAGTLPADANSVFTVYSFSRNTITWPSVAGRLYSIESSSDLVTWTPVTSNIPGRGNEITQPVNNTIAPYWRIRVSLP
jgi:hypothetical protein